MTAVILYGPIFPFLIFKLGSGEKTCEDSLKSNTKRCKIEHKCQSPIEMDKIPLRRKNGYELYGDCFLLQGISPVSDIKKEQLL